ncbi:MAG: hypothetical protein J3Q66DRAFT_340307 [Benniella sp.]|nr:MAG: hypothetical protein J3Q66DRAFT_340307 [Benniella sp.]
MESCAHVDTFLNFLANLSSLLVLLLGSFAGHHNEKKRQYTLRSEAAGNSTGRYAIFDIALHEQFINLHSGHELSSHRKGQRRS